MKATTHNAVRILSHTHDNGGLVDVFVTTPYYVAKDTEL